MSLIFTHLPPGTRLLREPDGDGQPFKQQEKKGKGLKGSFTSLSMFQASINVGSGHGLKAGHGKKGHGDRTLTF